jgi:hypothetical protein
MTYVRFDRMDASQQAEARALRPRLPAAEFANFEFWVKADGHLSRRGGHHQITEEAYQAILKKHVGTEPRTKGDLRDFKPGVTFHFDNSHRRRP